MANDFADSILSGVEGGIGLAQKVEQIQEQRRKVEEDKKDLALKRSDHVMNSIYKAMLMPAGMRKEALDRAVANSEMLKVPVNPMLVKMVDTPEYRTPFLQAAAGIAGLPPDERGQVMVGVMAQFAKPDLSDFGDNLIKLNEAISKRTMATQKAAPKEAIPIGTDKVILLTEMGQIPRRIEDLKKTIETNKEKFGFAKGRIGVANPNDTTAQLVNAQIRDLRQSIGRAKEGGVLRKEDEEKYAEILSQLSDNPKVALGKLDLISRDMALTYNDTINNLKVTGYNTQAFAPVKNVNTKIALHKDGKSEVAATGAAPAQGMSGAPQLTPEQQKRAATLNLKPGTPEFQARYEAYKKKQAGTAQAQAPAAPAAGLDIEAIPPTGGQ